LDIDRRPGRANGAAHRDGIGDDGHRISLKSRLRLEDSAHNLSIGIMPELNLTEEEKQRISDQLAADLQNTSGS